VSVTRAGRRVASLLSGHSLSAGDHSVPLSTAGLRPGLYFGRLEAGGRRATSRLVVVR
jgi:hypothetical protein